MLCSVAVLAQAARGLDEAGIVEAVVVTGHDLVEYRLLAALAAARVVVDDVHDGAQPHAAQPRDHLTELEDAGRTVGSVE